VVATETKISFSDIERDLIVVRGYDLFELAQRAHFADVAFLLIHGSLPGPGKRSMFANALGDGAVLPKDIQHVVEALPNGTHPMDALRTGLSALAGFERPHLLGDTGHGATVTKGVRILSAAPTIVASAYRATHDLPPAEPEHDMSYPARFLHMIPGAATDDEAVAIFDRVLTCHSEHGPDAAALAARAVASAGGDIYGAVTAAAAALRRRLHGGEIEERARGAHPRGALLRGDLLTLAARRDDAKASVTAYERAAEMMQRETSLFPESDMPSTLILHLLGIPVELFAPIFLCAHTAGLVAHVIEQHGGPHTPAAQLRYEGPSGLHLPRDFEPAPL
jgi:citrate synthase